MALAVTGAVRWTEMVLAASESLPNAPPPGGPNACEPPGLADPVFCPTVADSGPTRPDTSAAPA